jgi:hypothetical protein
VPVDPLPPAPAGVRWAELLQRLPDTLRIEISWDKALRIEISSGWILVALLALLIW